MELLLESRTNVKHKLWWCFNECPWKLKPLVLIYQCVLGCFVTLNTEWLDKDITNFSHIYMIYITNGQLLYKLKLEEYLEKPPQC